MSVSVMCSSMRFLSKVSIFKIKDIPIITTMTKEYSVDNQTKLISMTITTAVIVIG